MGSAFGLRSTRHYRWKALDDIYTLNRCARLGQCVEGLRQRASDAERTEVYEVFKVVSFFDVLRTRSRPVQNVQFDVLISI